VAVPAKSLYPPCDFDRVSRFYPLLERLVFGDALERSRASFISQVATARRVLLVGEGNGRFLDLALGIAPSTAELVVLDTSRRMLEAARRRCKGRPGGSRIRFVCGDARTWSPGGPAFDLFITHFVLDLFTPVNQDRLVVNLDAHAATEAYWIDVDFVPNPPQRAHQALMWLQYRFFRVVAAVEADRLYGSDAILQRRHWELVDTRRYADTLVQAKLWRRTKNEGGSKGNLRLR
jgi:SAM-dependent methyltransferase